MRQLASSLTEFIVHLYDSKSGGFRFTPTGGVNLLSTCFGVQLCYLINRLDLIDRRKTGAYIRNQQLANGEFLDQQFAVGDLRGRQTEQYIRWQFTFFGLTALDMLDLRPLYDISFLDDYLLPTILEDWLSNRDFIDFWYGSRYKMARKP